MSPRSTRLRGLVPTDAETLFEGTEVLLAVGGSSVASWANPTSDVDFFCVASPEVQRDVRALVREVPKSDIELRDVAWLDDFLGQLDRYEPPINGAYPPFSFDDLRFLARVLVGETLIDPAGLGSRARARTERLRLALIALVSVEFHNQYQDLFGLLVANRAADALPMAGNFVQRACLLAVLQHGLVDLAPKWAPVMAREHRLPELRTAASDLVESLRSCPSGAESAWLRGLLNRANSVVAIAVLATIDPDLTPRPRPDPGDLAGQFSLPALCLPAIPGARLATDVRDGRSFVYNEPFLRMLAGYASEPSSGADPR